MREGKEVTFMVCKELFKIQETHTNASCAFKKKPAHQH